MASSHAGLFSAEWVLGGVLVFAYAHGRFRTPRSNFGSTTMFRFLVSSSSYYASALLLYYFVGKALESSPKAAAAFMIGANGDIDEALKQVASPIVAALLLTALLPNAPVLSKAEQWFLHLFQDMGNIPREVRLWRDRLARTEPVFDEGTRRALRKRVADDPRFAAFPPAELRFEHDDSLAYYLTKAIYLMAAVDDFSVTPGRYPRVLDEFADDYVAITCRFDQALLSAVRYFPLVAGARDGAAHGAVLELRRALRERLSQLTLEICQLLARGILMSEVTHRDRRAKLQTLGFEKVEDASPPLDINHMLTLASVIFLICFSGVTLLTRAYDGKASINRGLALSAMMALLYASAIVCALGPKRTWRIASADALERRPVLGYLVSGAMSLGCAVAVSLLFKSFQHGNLWDAGRDFAHNSYPWLLITFVGAVSLAAMADNWGGRAETAPRWARAAEGLGQAVLLAAAALLVCVWLPELPFRDRAPPPAWVVVTLHAVIGFFLGAFVPHLYRRARSIAPHPVVRTARAALRERTLDSPVV